MPNRIQTTLAAVNGADYALLAGKADIYAYVNGQKASDESIGTKLTLALQGNRFSSLAVKFDHDPLPKVSDDDIITANSSGQYMYIQIPDCVVTLFSTSSGLGMVASATTAHLVTLKND